MVASINQWKSLKYDDCQVLIIHTYLRHEDVSYSVEIFDLAYGQSKISIARNVFNFVNDVRIELCESRLFVKSHFLHHFILLSWN